jgi:hypothetical protein
MVRGIALHPSDDDLRLAIARAISWRGVLRELGYATSNGLTAALLRERAVELGCDTAHFWTRRRGGPRQSTCKICGRRYEYVRASGSTLTSCNSCKVNQRRFALKVKIVAFLGGKCADCGYDQCLAAMHVHHLEADGKEFNLSGAHARSWASIEAELLKCILLCANCHATRHHDHVRGLCPVGSNPSVL